MKHIFVLFTTMLLSTASFSQADAISRYFEQYMDDTAFTMVYISPKMFQFISDMDIQSDDVDQDVIEIISELKGLRILSLEDSNRAGKIYREAREKIDISLYEELIVARDDEENVHIMATSEGDIVTELLMLIGGDDSFALLSFVGNIDLKKVGKLAQMLNVDGAEHLEKLEEK